MEGLKGRLWALALIVAGFGAVTAFVPPRSRQAIDEDWMERRSPERVGDFAMVRSAEDPGQSYRMNEITYKTLQPAGIVSRLYRAGDKVFDVVLIASDNSRSFHDPRVCFTASGWNIVSQREAEVKTKTRGSVPVTFVKMSGAGGLSRSALFFFRGPGGFIPQARSMRLKMFLAQVTQARNEQGVFYRVIPMTDGTTDEELLEFTGNYLDASGVASQGFF